MEEKKVKQCNKNRLKFSLYTVKQTSPYPNCPRFHHPSFSHLTIKRKDTHKIVHILAIKLINSLAIKLNAGVKDAS